MKFDRKVKKIIMSFAVAALIGAAGVNADAQANITKIAGADRVATSIESSKLVKSDVMVVANAYSFADSLSAYNLVSKLNAKLVLVDKKTDLTKVLDAEPVSKVYLVGGESTLSGNVVRSIENKVKNIERVSGDDRYATNSETLKISGYDSVGVANGNNYPDALSATALLKRKNLGLMLVDGKKEYITDKKVVYTFGEKGSVVQDGGKRLGGADRYATNMKVLQEIGPVDNVAIADGQNFADALSSVNLVTAKQSSVMIVSNRLNDEQKNYVNNTKAQFIIGGAVNENISRAILGKPLLPDKNDNKPVSNAKIKLVIKEITDNDVQDVGNVMIDRFDTDKIRSSVSGNYVILSSNDVLTKNYEAQKNSKQAILNVYVISKENYDAMVKNEKSYEYKIFYLLKNGISKETNFLVAGNVNSSLALDELVQGMGFSIEQKFDTISGDIDIKRAHITMGIRQSYYTKEDFTKDDYMNNIRKIDELIEKSGADKENTDTEKAYTFAKYIKATVPYNEESKEEGTLEEEKNMPPEYHRRARSPYSITNYNTAVCEAYTYTLNQAMFRMGILSIFEKHNGHMVADVYLDGAFRMIDATGWRKSKLTWDIKPSDITNKGLEPESKYTFPDAEKRRKIALELDFLYN